MRRRVRSALDRAQQLQQHVVVDLFTGAVELGQGGLALLAVVARAAAATALAARGGRSAS